jgi:hypothetical protein
LMLLLKIFLVSLCLVSVFALDSNTWRQNGHDSAHTYRAPYLGPALNSSSGPLFHYQCTNLNGCQFPRIAPDSRVYLPEDLGNVIHVFDGINFDESTITFPSSTAIVNIAFTVMNDLIFLNWMNKADLYLVSYNISSGTNNWSTLIASNVIHSYYQIQIEEPYIVLSNGERGVFVFNTMGSAVWNLSTNSITAISNGYLVALMGSTLKVINISNSSVVSSTLFPNPMYTLSVMNGIAYTCYSRTGTATGCAATNILTGKVVWERGFGNDVLGISTSGTLIVSDSQDIYFLEALTGKFLFGITGQHNYNGAISSNNLFYIGLLTASRTTKLAGINMSNGLTVWSYTAPSYINTYTMLSAPGYLYFFDATNNILYAFQ